MQDDLPRKQPLRLATPQTYIEESTSDIVGTFRLPQWFGDRGIVCFPLPTLGSLRLCLL